MKNNKIMNGKIFLPEYIAVENQPFTVTQKTIRDTILSSNSNVLYFTVARQQGTTTMFLEDIITGLYCGVYTKIQIIIPKIISIRQKIQYICNKLKLSYSNIINKIYINSGIVEDMTEYNYDYIYVEDFEFLDENTMTYVEKAIKVLNTNDKSSTKLILTSSINDNFDFRYFKYTFINNRYNVHYKIVDPQLNPEMLEYMRHMLKDEDAFRREILCKRKYEVIEEEKKPLLVEDILSMTVNEAIDYCAKNGIELKISFDKF